METILLVDDDPELAELLKSYMHSEGFALEAVYDGKSGMKMLEKNEYELVLLDVMLPDTSGFNVLAQLRLKSEVPVIMLTGRGEEIDRVVGLEMGADDYVSKPFQLRELLARIRAVLRRYGSVRTDDHGIKPAPQKRSIRFGQVFLNRSARNLTLSEQPVHLTTTEFDILELLALNLGNVVERGDLMEGAMGRGEDFDDYVLNVHMSNLRKKLGKDVSIKTIRGRGYLLAAPQAGAM